MIERIIPRHSLLFYALCKKGVTYTFRFGVMILFSSIANAYLLDWTQVNWNPSTSASQFASFNDVDNSQIDISISISLNGASNLGAPTSIVNDNIKLGVNYSNRNRQTNYIDVTLIFSQAVQFVSFSLNDVDKGGTSSNAYWEDVIENIEASMNGTQAITTPTFIGSEIATDTVTEPGDILYRGTESNSWDSDSRLTLSWQTAIDKVSFRYSGGENTINNPSYQTIGLSGVSFHHYTAVPESNTYLAGALGSIAVLFMFLRKRRTGLSRSLQKQRYLR